MQYAEAAGVVENCLMIAAINTLGLMKTELTGRTRRVLSKSENNGAEKQAFKEKSRKGYC
jgi:hypothetical protein